MAKCGKGCMPECEHFTTGGCISPFNCPYKIETGYINSATSTTDSLTGILMEFDKMGLLRQRRASDSEKYAIEWRGKERKEIEHLKPENADLRERLDKAEHRAEVMERALLWLCDKTMRNVSVMAFPSTKTQVRNKQELYDYCIAQAQKELAEERKDG